MKLGEKSEAKVELIADGEDPNRDYEMPKLADQKDTEKGDRLNLGNYDYVNALNRPVQNLTDQLIMFLVRGEISKMLPSIPLTKK